MTTTWLTAHTNQDPLETFRGDQVPAVDPALEPTVIERYVLLRELGRGGMGAVFLARQAQLGREVAIKRSLRPEGESLLLAEASITGKLEHPNVVPVYDISTDEDGVQLVMKRVEGTVWTELISGEAPLPTHATDPVAWHIGVLVDVCQAVAFAHARGFIHRDLKPDNVMIGAFGEVYVMDWGLAVRTARTRSGLLADLVGQRHLQGTPAYMPPEMFVQEGPVGEASDTYLLGATLWHCLAGQPQRAGGTMEQMRDRAAQPVAAPATWPEALRRLLGHAMDPDVKARPTAAAFRDELQRYLASHASQRLLEGAADLVETVEARAAEVPYEAFGAAQFVLRDLQRSGPHVTAAALGQRLVVAMIRRQLDAENPGAAAALLEQGDVPSDLRDEVDKALSAERGARTRLTSLETHYDRETFAGARLALGVALGAVWIGAPLVMTMLGMDRGIPWMVVHGTVTGVTLIGGLMLLWRQLRGSYVNWSIAVLVSLHPTYTLCLAGIAHLTNLTPEQLTPIRALVDGLLILVISLLFDHRLTPWAVWYVAASLLVAAFPAWASLILIPSTGALVVLIVAVWGLPALATWWRGRQR